MRATTATKRERKSPTMPKLQFAAGEDLRSVGPVCAVTISASAGGIPQNGKALIDTGSDWTYLLPRVVSDLGIPPHPTKQMVNRDMEGNTQVTPLHLGATLAFWHPAQPDKRVSVSLDWVSPRQLFSVPEGVIALVGRDALRHLRLEYDGRSGCWTLANE